MIYKFIFEVQCPFRPLPPQKTEIRCAVQNGEMPVFSIPNVCDRCNGTNIEQCEQCVTALHLMFQQGLVPLELHPSCPVRVLSDPILPSLALLSARSPHSPQ